MPLARVISESRRRPSAARAASTLSPKTAARLIRLIHSERGGGRATRIRFTLEHTHETAVHLLPAHATLNAHPVLGTTEPLRQGKGLYFTFPRNGVMPPFILTAGSPGIADVWLGDEAFRLQPLTTGGRPVGRPLNAACPAPHPLVPIFPAIIQ